MISPCFLPDDRERKMRMETKIVLDAMGGDNAPVEPIKGAVDALKEDGDIRLILTGKEELLRTELAKYSYPEDRVTIVDCEEVIETGEPPVKAIQSKRNSSLVVGLQLVRRGEADAFVSSGSTGAVLVGGQTIVRKIRGVERAPLAPLIPTQDGMALLIDCGANVDARPSHLVQFARMGSIYMENIMHIRNPRVAIVNIGAEEEKGNALVKETFPLLQACEDINFVGNIEARDIPKGKADVIVTEAFVGNVILKLYEGVGSVLIGKIKEALYSSTRGKIGGALIKPALKGVVKSFDSSEYGGAPMLGLRGLVVKSHGSSNAKEFKNAILQCALFHKQDITGKMVECFTGEKK